MLPSKREEEVSVSRMQDLIITVSDYIIFKIWWLDTLVFFKLPSHADTTTWISNEIPNIILFLNALTNTNLKAKVGIKVSSFQLLLFFVFFFFF